jgi:hypothetical protein
MDFLFHLGRLDDNTRLKIIESLGPEGLKQLRLCCKAACALVQPARVKLSVADLSSLHRPLRQLFPMLTRLELEEEPEATLTADDFAEFALDQLSLLPSLAELSLRGCKLLGTSAALVLQHCCPQLQVLDLTGTGGPPAALPRSPAAPLCVPFRTQLALADRPAY